MAELEEYAMEQIDVHYEHTHIEQEFNRIKDYSIEHPNRYHEENKRYRTQRGERVRSKGERAIANRLYKKGIPYVYEPCLQLEDSQIVYPDFIILHRKENRLLIWEHLGMMDKPEYRMNWWRKLEQYIRNKNIEGDNLIISSGNSRRNIERQVDIRIAL